MSQNNAKLVEQLKFEQDKKGNQNQQTGASSSNGEETKDLLAKLEEALNSRFYFISLLLEH